MVTTISLLFFVLLARLLLLVQCSLGMYNQPSEKGSVIKVDLQDKLNNRMANKEATARIKINKLLESAGWLFFTEGSSPANIRLEPSVTIKSSDLDDLGDNFEKTSKGFIDFLLLDTKGFPLIVLEAKSEDKNPLVGKEQARKYAKAQNCRFVIRIR